MTVVVEATRFCEQCVQVKPLTEFRRRSRTGSARLHQCQTCHSQTERERRASKREQQDHRRMASWLTKLKNERSNDRLELLCHVMLQQFGGMENFVTAWIDYQRRAIDQSGFAAFRCFQSLLRLMQYCEEKRPAASEMTEEELERSVMQHMKQLIQQHPELAIAAANEIGWTVTPGGFQE